MQIDQKALIELASAAQSHFFCLYSKFAVGAAILTSSGKIYTGSNVEMLHMDSRFEERSAAIKTVNDGGN